MAREVATGDLSVGIWGEDGGMFRQGQEEVQRVCRGCQAPMTLH